MQSWLWLLGAAFTISQPFLSTQLQNSTSPAFPNVHCQRLTAASAVIGFVRSFGRYLPEEKITLNAICPNIVKTNISTGEFYSNAEEKGLLISVDTLVEAFESLLGGNGMSGEAVEVLPGSEGYRVKEIPEYTNEKVKQSVEMTLNRPHRSHKFHEPILD